MFENAINLQLFAGTDYNLQFVPEQLDVFQVDESLRAASLLQLVTAGVSLAEAMLMLGYDPLENKPEPPAEVVVEEDAEDAQVASELATWQRFALRNLNKTNQREFETHHVPAYMADQISNNLVKASTTKEVKEAFEPRRFLGWESYTEPAV
jgi:hypothetical protein